MTSVSIRNLSLNFGAVSVLKALNLDVEDGEFLVLLGPSGCGKSTLLNCIAGLLDVSDGQIFIKDRNVTWEEPKDRGIGMVFQSYALYPQMTVERNLSFGLRVARTPKEEIERRVARAAEILQIEPLLTRKPAELSGGQRQRVAIGRALVRDVDVFLFDEPLSNLDAKLRVQMRTEIKKVHQQVKTTTVYVTHDQVEAMTLADRVVVMNQGRIDQIGDPNVLYHSPRTRFVAGFIGSPAMNFINARLVQAGSGMAVRLNENISLPIPPEREARYKDYLDKEVVFGLRPEHITEVRRHHETGTVEFQAQLDVVEPMGSETMVYFTINGDEVAARVNPALAGKAESAMMLLADMNHMHLIDPDTDLVI